MNGHDRSTDRTHDDCRDEIRPTVWGYSTWTTARCAQGGVAGSPGRIVQRTDVLVPGLTPRELDRVRRHAEWHASVDGVRLGLVAGTLTALAVLGVGAAQGQSPATLVVVAATLGVAAALLARGLLHVAGPRLSRAERRALRDAVEIRRVRVAPPTSAGMRVLVSMSAVESISGRLDDREAAIARELLWVALDAVRRDDVAAVDEATGAMLRLTVRAARTPLPPVRDEHLG
ncbi:hypothetical protein [Cellulosimicrobium protaetiae]|uniref:Uncharacterized protein n=1 Tax=Cellulosimicrobium protaetiae TaxID=2587808 RepID=A0A6M5UBU7_9MICO|nr:hypothetical protein [Cellulosimicrobium protaetiae]QJW35957.1 hypothetical protein FIC82_006870 [Cellulosimicrobium protaetiae]